MNTRSSIFATVAAAACSVALSYAVAQPPAGGAPITITHPATPGGGGNAPSEPLVIHDPYSESAHFVVRHLRLDGQGPTLHVQPGTTVHASLEINEHCASCATPHNHILVGFQGQQTAAACAWSGLRESGGWRTQQFSLIAPMRPGVYPVRVRGVSTGRPTCDDETMSYWTRDLPGGPGPDATIGVIVVESPRIMTTPPPAGTTTSATTTTTTGVAPSGGPLATTSTTTTVTTTTTAATAPATIANASFEQPDVQQGQSVPMAQILGWTRSFGNGVEIHDRMGGAAASGDQWVELDGTDSSGISAEVSTVPGTSYLVSLAFAARPGTHAADNRLEVRWNGEVVATLSASGEGSGIHWTRVSVRVRATNASGRLELRDAGTSNGMGTFVDDVSIARGN